MSKAQKAKTLDSYYAGAAKTLKPKGDGQSESTELVTAPKVWKSSNGHPTAYLVYISAKEAKLLAKADVHGSGVDKEMHFGPNGVPSYQGDGGSGGGDGGGDGGDGGGGSSGGAEGGSSDSEGSQGESGGGGASTDGGGGGDVDDGTGFSGPGADVGAADTGGEDSSGGAGDISMSEALAVTTLESPASVVEKRSDMPEQFATREQTVRRRASVAGAQRGGNMADLLGYVVPKRMKGGVARRTLGSGR